MPTKRRQLYHIESHHFIILFWIITVLLYGARRLATAGEESENEENKIEALETENHQTTKAAERVPELKTTASAKQDEPNTIALPDSIEKASNIVDELFLCPRSYINFLDEKGKPVHHKVRKMDVSDIFNDINEVQLATASLIGAAECETRDQIRSNQSKYVYIGASPYYDIEELTYSVPYLVPRAAILLDEIGHAFLDSLTAKGIPFHKLVVTSVLRTNEDVEKLTRRNKNATEHSCHRFGTTFDIAYRTYYRVSDPDEEKKTEWSAKELMPILAEVLDDQRKLGTCYIKHETRKRCFHITCR